MLNNLINKLTSLFYCETIFGGGHVVEDTPEELIDREAFFANTKRCKRCKATLNKVELNPKWSALWHEMIKNKDKNKE